MQDKNIKTFTVRFPRETWAFLKKYAIDQNESMNELIIYYVEREKAKMEKKLEK